MRNLNLETQLIRIEEKLVLAKEKDKEFEEFGSSKHKYVLNEKVSEKAVADFELQYKIQLPEEFKSFLIKLGNGGAGPYYGIYGLSQISGANGEKEFAEKPCKLHPYMSDEEWEELTKFSEEENIGEEQSDFLYSSLYQGMINIGTQGCTYEMMLVVTGKYKGRIVYIDLDLQKPFVTFENNFLDWYERWLDEIIKGYDTSWFGMKIGGDDTTLIKFFQESTSEMEKVDALYGMCKLPEILPSTFEFLENQCRNESEKIKKTALGVLSKSSFLRAKPFLLEFLEDDLEEIRLIALQFIHWYGKDNKHEMTEPVRKLLEKTNNAESFRFITYILESDENNDASIYIPFFYNTNIEIRKTAIYTVGKHKDREKFLKDFINCLKSEDGWIVHTAIQALSGVTNKELLPLYAELLNKYKSEEFYIRSNVMSNLKAFGKDGDYIFQQE